MLMNRIASQKDSKTHCISNVSVPWLRKKTCRADQSAIFLVACAVGQFSIQMTFLPGMSYHDFIHMIQSVFLLVS